jgi:hypothetical protein
MPSEILKVSETHLGSRESTHMYSQLIEIITYHWIGYI